MIDPINLLTHFTLLSLVKWMILAALTLYTFFAFLISKQIKVMNKAVSTQYGQIIYQLGFIHFLTSLLVLILALIIL